MGFVAELKRRNVIRMAGLYLVGAWVYEFTPRLDVPVPHATATGTAP